MVSRKRSLAKVAQFSAWARPGDQLSFAAGTVHGGLVTAVGLLLVLVLFISEAKRCFTSQIIQKMEVDVTRRETITVSFDISFPALPCAAISLDAGDVSGKFKTDATVRIARDGQVKKYVLDQQGKQVSGREYEGKPHGQLPFFFAIDEDVIQDIKRGLLEHQGCRIKGWLEIARVAGNIHLAVNEQALLATAPGTELASLLLNRHIQLGGLNIHPDASKLNASHIIHAFNFGPSFPGQLHPLKDVIRIDRKATGVDKYFIKLVPTDYKARGGIHTHQMSVTEYYHEITAGEQMQPGIYFLYDVWPMKVILKKTRPGLLVFMVRVCAVVGGGFAFTGLVHRVVDLSVDRVITRKSTM